MKYYKIRIITSSGASAWIFYDLPDSYTIDDVKDLYYEDNNWVFDLESKSVEIDEITEQEYKIGTQAMKYFERNLRMLQENVFPVKEWAILLANSNKPVRIGYPNFHMVYRMNENRELSYQFDYDAAKFGVLKSFEKAYPV